MACIYTGGKEGESLAYREIVQRCWDTAHNRYGAGLLNGTFPDGDIRDALRIPEKSVKYASEVSDKGFFTARGFTRVLRVARTIADIKEAPDVTVEDIAEAVQYRRRDF